MIIKGHMEEIHSWELYSSYLEQNINDVTLKESVLDTKNNVTRQFTLIPHNIF